MQPQWWQILQFLNNTITWEFSEQNISLLPYRRVQYFRITCTVLVTNWMIMFWRQVLAYGLPKTLDYIQARQKSFSVLCRGVLQWQELQQHGQAYSPPAANSRHHHWLGKSALKVKQCYFKYSTTLTNLCKAISKISQTTVTVKYCNQQYPSSGPAKSR